MLRTSLFWIYPRANRKLRISRQQESQSGRPSRSGGNSSTQGKVLRAAAQCMWDVVQMTTKRSIVSRVGTCTFMDRLAYSHGPTNHRDGTECPKSLRAQNAHEGYGS